MGLKIFTLSERIFLYLEFRPLSYRFALPRQAASDFHRFLDILEDLS